MGAASFDGIVYQKGSTILKQLLFLIGDGAGQINFLNFIKEYLQTYGYQNATTDNLVEVLSKYFANPEKIIITDWDQMWLNSISPTIL